MKNSEWNGEPGAGLELEIEWKISTKIVRTEVKGKGTMIATGACVGETSGKRSFAGIKHDRNIRFRAMSETEAK